MNKALFLDIDGTIIETNSGSKFPLDIHDWKLKDFVVQAIQEYNDKGYIIIVVSNQGGIEHGYVKKEALEQKLKNIDAMIRRVSDLLPNWYYCQHMKSYSRKPNPGMAYMAALEHELDLSECIMVGDASGICHMEFEEEDRDSYLSVQSRLTKAGRSNSMKKIKDKIHLSYESHSESDAEFADNLGMMYYDIEQFIEEWKVGRKQSMTLE